MANQSLPNRILNMKPRPSRHVIMTANILPHAALSLAAAQYTPPSVELVEMVSAMCAFLVPSSGYAGARLCGYEVYRCIVYGYECFG